MIAIRREAHAELFSRRLKGYYDAQAKAASLLRQALTAAKPMEAYLASLQAVSLEAELLGHLVACRLRELEGNKSKGGAKNDKD